MFISKDFNNNNKKFFLLKVDEKIARKFENKVEFKI